MTLASSALGCASAPSVPLEGPEPEAPAAPPIVQPGDGYVMYYVDGTDVRMRNTAAAVDSVVLSGVSDVQASASPDGHRLALAYSRDDSTALVLVDALAGDTASVHSGPGGRYTLAWSADGDALGAGHQPHGGQGGAVLVVDREGNVRNIGCSVSNRFVAWRSNGQVIVSDGANIYTVDTRNCGTLSTLAMRDKTHITFSPDGNLVLYVRNEALVGARYDGGGSQYVARARYQARNAQWAPDSRRIAFEVQSERYGNVTHLAIYQYATGQMSVHDEEQPLGVPRDMNPCWSPSGDRIAYDRDYLRSGGGQEYVQRQKVVRSLTNGEEVVVVEELVRDVSRAERTACGWVDDSHIAVKSADGPRIFHIETKVTYRMPQNSRLLYARVIG